MSDPSAQEDVVDETGSQPAQAEAPETIDGADALPAESGDGEEATDLPAIDTHHDETTEDGAESTPLLEETLSPSVVAKVNSVRTSQPSSMSAVNNYFHSASGNVHGAGPSEGAINWVKERLLQLAPDADALKEAEIPSVQEWMARSLTPRHENMIREFLAGEIAAKRFFASVQGVHLNLTHNTPNAWEKMMYFVRRATDEPLNEENVASAVLYGMLTGGDPYDGLLRLMNGVFIPGIVSNESWPETVRKEFIGHVHKFMAHFTEQAYEKKAQTVLYIPKEKIADSTQAADDKDLVQRLESCVIHWTRQIKEVVNYLDNSEVSQDAGPLAEIEFWRSRNRDLSGIRRQLEDSEVARFKQVLAHAQSSYLPSFLELSQKIQEEALCAEDNLKFLGILEAPCLQLAKASPREVPAMLPKLLLYIRLIWDISGHYNTEERITNLLRKVSNEIINRCCSSIALTEIWGGDVEGVIRSLDDSIKASESWKTAYLATANAVNHRSPRPWSFDVTSIFANIDAFMQRCRDLLEVCEAQLQFAPKGEVPSFGGTRGPEVTKSILDIQATFQKLVSHLKSLRYSILDVKATRWHDDFNTFKSGVKDLEVMFNNVISLAAETTASIPRRIELLEVLQSMAKRDAIKRCVEKLTLEAYQYMAAEINVVKKQFDALKRGPPVSPFMPRYSGAAMWADALAKRVRRPLEQLMEAEPGLPQVSEAQEVKQAATTVLSAIQQYIQHLHDEWKESIDPNIGTGLEKNLITMDESASGLLVVDFDKRIMTTIREIFYWEKLRMGIPYHAMEINAAREKLRVLQENVLSVVRDYNKILTALDREERRLFGDRIRSVDRRIAPGIQKLTWMSPKHHLDFYMQEAHLFCQEVWKNVEDWKVANMHIDENCKIISESLLVLVEKKKVYDHLEFAEHQSKHLAKMREKFELAYNEICSTLQQVYTNVFARDSDEVQAEWLNYMRRVDRMFEDALRHSIKRSLQELNRVINGDKKTEVVPVFSMTVVLDSQRGKVEMRPTMQELGSAVMSACEQIVSICKAFPRIQQLSFRPGATNAQQREAQAAAQAEEAAAAAAAVASESSAAVTASVEGSEAGTSPPTKSSSKMNFTRTPSLTNPQVPAGIRSFYDIIRSDNDVVKSNLEKLLKGLRDIIGELGSFLDTFDEKYRPIPKISKDGLWDKNKDKFIKRYENIQRPFTGKGSWEEDIQVFLDRREEIQKEESTKSNRFLRFDVTPLKHTLIAHCNEWVTKLTGSLNSLASNELRNLHDYFHSNTDQLSRPPLNLEELGQQVNLHKKLVAEKADISARFDPLSEMYHVLLKFDVQVTQEEKDLLEALTAEWAKFQKKLDVAGADLELSKDNFREKLVKIVDSYVKELATERKSFEENAPYGHDGFTVVTALNYVKSHKERTGALRKKANELRDGMEIFNIPQPPYKELAMMEKDIELLEQIWELVKTWQASYNTWKDGLFKDINVAEMEEFAQKMGKSVTKLGREIKGWSVLVWIKETIDSFKKTMPLVIDLRNQAMRSRHWDQLMEHIGERFDPHGTSFTLNTIIKLKLDQHVEFIGELSTNATKELAIEVSLGKIAEAWKTLSLDMAPYKQTYKLRSTEEIFLALEDNVVTLSTMKASKYFLVFEKEINKWEQILSLVSETIEMILQVQRNWMYLENIFVGSEDIRKQLPQESIMFEQVHNTFQACMKKLVDTSLVVKACSAEMLETFNDMDAKLERIQKSLENYLESKRQQFPRFYFLSSDDLLEILGQAKDPMNVQPHLKKCFEGIKKLEMFAPGQDGRKFYEATGIFSPDGEWLPFQSPVKTEGRPEDWLNDIEAAMFKTTKMHLYKILESSKSMKKEQWVRQNQGQMIITAGQIVWTLECERALADAEEAKRALKQLKKKWVSYLNKLTAVTRSRLNKIERNKVVALITIEVHARDVIDKLIKHGCSSPNDFEWLSQLRFMWDKEQDDCIVKQVMSVFTYGYEYQGNNGRLVITPLTDRCYMTLGAAMFTRRGGNPLGPAGTGKTETVKDFGKALARYVIVFNCSDGVDFKMTGKMFSGLAQTGAWACLDEFNRIEVEVLSVVATQIATVMQAIKERKRRFLFLGQEIRLIPSCGIFVTMNPGYAGRSELPDNLKAILRPVAMMVPDFTLIAEIMMFSEGFQSAKVLSKKMIAIMELSQQQLSKQDHYDYGLRSFVIPIARAAGSLKRADPDASEEVIMYQTMLNLIKPKLVFLDLPLFMALLSDLFPGVELPQSDGGILKRAIEADLKENNLQVVPEFVTKIIQIFDCKVARHGNMIVGKTGAGKSEAWKCLQRAMGKLKKEAPEDERYQTVHVFTINPLALSNDEMYGSFDPGTHEWTDGVLARIMRNTCRDETHDQKWILFDGPVDTLWIESMNTTLDDNKLLTLLSGERIAMTPQVSLLFEVEDLSQASPATVSRAGMIYLNVEDLGLKPYITSWLNSKQRETVLVETLTKLIDKFIEPALEFKRHNCKDAVSVDRLNAVKTLFRLWDSLATEENGISPSEGDQYPKNIDMWFKFCLVWSVGASLDDDGRRKFSSFLREHDQTLPTSETMFDYWVDPKRKAWAPWEEKLPSSYKPPSDVPFFRIMVPTIDTVRTRYVVNALISGWNHTLIVGGVGVGKTMIAQSALETLPEGRASMTINFSAQTSSNSLQETIEGKLEKRTKGVFAPQGGKKLVCFIDDLNMPQKSKFGFIPPLELLKLWVDNGFWYDRAKQEVKHVKDMQLLAAMAPPGGGRNQFSQRVQACFSLINITNPSDTQLRRIFSTLLNNKLADFEDDIKPLGDLITQGTVNIYRLISKELLPTPSKSHYLFNTRDLAKIIQGVMQATKQFYDSKDIMLQLWCHETFRIIGDRMWDLNDKTWLQKQLDSQLTDLFGSSWNTVFEAFDGQMPPFVAFNNFMRNMDIPPYEAVQNMGQLKDYLTEKLEDYGMEPGHSSMDLVLFKDAMHHVCRIHRVLMQPRGNALLVGVGGSGRKSLSKLATYIAEQKCFSIEITKNYRITEFREDLKNLYRLAGCQNKPTTFLFDETQIVTETFLEDVNNILTSGEVPNLFGKDDLPGVLDEVRPAAKKAGIPETADQLYAFFLEQVRTNLHVILCLSPVGEAFRERCRMFPGLVNCTTIDWFTEWPSDALYEVAQKQLDDLTDLDAALRSKLSQVFVTVHTSVADTSRRMLNEVKRHNYVTPTNYLETVRGYKVLLKEKVKDLTDKAKKLRGGLLKLDETGEQVQSMQKICAEKKIVVAQAKKDCEELLVQIVQDKRVADEQEKQVNAEAQKIGKEAEEANAIARECQEGLDKAMPALQAAEDALNVLNKKELAEVRAYAKPPGLVELALSGVMVVLRKTPSWDEAKKQLGDPSFMEKLIKFDKDKLDEQLLKKINKYTSNPDYDADKIGKVSAACRGLCLWVRAMEVYGVVSKEVAPKRAKLKAAQDNLSKKQAALKAAQDKLAEVLAQVQALRDKYDTSMTQKKELEDELEDLEGKLQRAEKLVSGLAGEKTRWEASISEFEAQALRLPGDCVVAAAFLSYAGPFPSEYRDSLVTHTWLPQVKALQIPASENFAFASFLANPSDVRDWNIQGLPADSFSTENGVIVTRGRRWPLMIDPQGQANKWVKNMEGGKGLKVVNLQMSDLLRQMENGISFGHPVLLQDVLEEVDPTLEPILAKSFIKRGNQILIKLGDKEVDYNFDFRLYITTKLANPHYKPEISTKVALVNFSVKEQGLEAQLLSTVVKCERPDLDEMKNELVVKVAKGKRTQAELEDQILYMLSTATGSLLDNIELIQTLDQSKTTWEEVNESLKVAEETSKKIEAASQEYRPVSVRASLLYFVLNDLALIDPMYQFSLDAYNELFLLSIQKSPKSENLQDRIRNLNDFHTFAVYKYTARGLFERHKLLLSLQMCVRILQNGNQINNDEWQFFLKGGSVLDRSSQARNPAPHWISESSWDNITELESLPNFGGCVSSFDQMLHDWEIWYRSNEPESAELPGEWDSKCNELQRMIFIRCMRPDRVIFAATTFVANALGRKFVEPPVLELGETHADSTATTPLIFVLSPGVDPLDNLIKLATERGIRDKFFQQVALGQGQAPIATKLIEEGIVKGHWVFLANCHLMTSWLPTLDKIIEKIESRRPHPDFRLWLSSNPTPDFPISILQRSIKMTTEPPKGLRANLLRLYNTVSEDSFAECKSTAKYQKLLFALTYFHSVLLERRKFRTLGFNIPYDFNDTDYKVSDDLLKSYLDAYVDTPWEALKYLIAEANYGGRVTDELDRRVLRSYLDQFYCEEALHVPNYKLSPLAHYYIPDNGTLQSYKDYVATLPATDRPEAFGQHPNADISYQTEDSMVVLDSLVSLQPRTGGASSGGKNRDEFVFNVAADLLQQVPEPYDLEAVMKSKADDPSPLHVVLFQEVERYSILLRNMRSSCAELQKGIKGLVVMSADLDLIFDALNNGKVPAQWLKTYPSLKPLGNWTRDLMHRLEQIKNWVNGTYPNVYWLSGFTYPTGFLTAVLQTTARKNSIPIDTLSFEYVIVNTPESELTTQPKEGVYVKGVFLEGAGWDHEEGTLCEPEPMQLIVPMPIIHFKPVENKKKTPKGIYVCPLYMYPVRTGTRERPSFMLNVDLKSGNVDADFWIKRGTGLLLDTGR